MNIHKEGITICIITILLLVALWYYTYTHPAWWAIAISIPLTLIGAWVFHFFRNPDRTIETPNEHLIYAPADGKVVVIEEVDEPEFFKGKKKMVSIFMSPMSVHVNRAPFSGTFEYVKHHNGRFLAAWDPKSSTENERSTVVISGLHATILLRQVAGALARRIITYARPGKSIRQGEEFGFIRFGSRVDIYLPLNAKVNVQLDQMVRGNVDVIAEV